MDAIDEDVEIIACAGAGKTGVVTRRIINILKQKKDVLPENIVAFTFTEKAAKELKARIYKYGEKVLGHTKGFANMYVGTIHGFCLKMLKEYIPEFQKFTVLNEIRTKLFIEKNYDTCGMSDLGLRKYVETNLFLSVMSLLNENLFEESKWDVTTRTAVQKYKSAFYEKKYFDYSLIMQEMLHQLETNAEFANIISNKIKYLTIDEYQDTNPVQERLIQFIKKVVVISALSAMTTKRFTNSEEAIHLISLHSGKDIIFRSILFLVQTIEALKQLLILPVV